MMNGLSTTLRFSGKRVVIVGGACGIGLGCVQRFAAEGARVLILDILERESASAAGKLRAEGSDVDFSVCDASDRLQISSVMKNAVEHGGIDILVYAAGIGGASVDFLRIDPDEFDRVQQINLRAPMLFGQTAAAHMIETGRKGAIIFIGSVAAVLASPQQAAYCVSKAALAMLVKVMGVSLATRGVRVNAVAPGPVRTEMSERYMETPGAREGLMLRTPIGRLGEIEEIAGTVAFLASDDAAFFVGQSLYPDGGRLALNHVVSKEA